MDHDQNMMDHDANSGKTHKPQANRNYWTCCVFGVFCHADLCSFVFLFLPASKRWVAKMYTPRTNHGSGWHAPLDHWIIIFLRKRMVNSTSRSRFLNLVGDHYLVPMKTHGLVPCWCLSKLPTEPSGRA